MKKIIYIFGILLLTLTLFKLQGPWFTGYKYQIGSALAALSFCLTYKNRQHLLRMGLFLLIGLCACIQMFSMNQRKEFTMHASPEVLQLLGKHIIVGYHDIEELKILVRKGAVGGVFISQRNLRGKSFEEMKAEIESLQEIQHQAGRDALFIASDQEGGLVSKLSPLLTRLPPLSKVLEDKPSPEQLAFKVKDYASTQAKELFDLGINVNFAPVVDLKNTQPKDFIDTHSLLDLRSISSDPNEVSEVTTHYIEAYKGFGVIPTLKHFPGMGSIKQDTHFKSGVLDLSKKELEEKDWIPFKQNLSPTKSWIMMGHTKIAAIDSQELADLSPKVIQGLIRDEWQHEGVLISDDFSMGPVYSRNGGVGVAATDALNAGLDMILISYDPDLYYEIMHGLIKAFEQNKLNTIQLGKSDERLKQSSQYLMSFKENKKSQSKSTDYAKTPLLDLPLHTSNNEDACDVEYYR